MTRGKGLQRRTPLRAKVGLRRKKRLAPVSEKRLEEMGERLVIREAVFARDGHLCRLNPRSLFLPHGFYSHSIPRCAGPLTYHHVLKASAGGDFSEANGMALCSFHNQYVEDHPATARDLGLVILSWER